MAEVKILSNKEAKNRFCSYEERSKVVTELTKRALERGLTVVTIQKSTKYTAGDMEKVKKDTLLYGYQTVYVIGLSINKKEIVLACEKI